MVCSSANYLSQDQARSILVVSMLYNEHKLQEPRQAVAERAGQGHSTWGQDNKPWR